MGTAQTGRTHDLHPTASRNAKLKPARRPPMPGEAVVENASTRALHKGSASRSPALASSTILVSEHLVSQITAVSKSKRYQGHFERDAMPYS